jgi:hypothetical protein
MDSFLSNPYVAGAIVVIAIFYGSLARPELPMAVHRLFDNSIFRFVVLTLIAWVGSKNIQVALVIAIVFMITMNLLSEQKLSEGFVAYTLESFQNPEPQHEEKKEEKQPELPVSQPPQQPEVMDASSDVPAEQTLEQFYN